MIILTSKHKALIAGNCDDSDVGLTTFVHLDPGLLNIAATLLYTNVVVLVTITDCLATFVTIFVWPFVNFGLN